MTETSSNVYDLVHPSPATLKEISSSALVSGLWRWEAENRVSSDLEKLLFVGDLLENLDANMPSPVKRMMDAYSCRFIASVNTWLDYHYKKVFHFHRNDDTTILHDFFDFICDQDGTIHYIRTAKRMMTCDRLSDDEKFKISCVYSFEDDVTRIWPSVSEKLDLNGIHFDDNPELFYWIYKMRNDPTHLLGIDRFAIDSIEETMLLTCSSYTWSSVEYFWNRIHPENRLVCAVQVARSNKELFVSFILPKFSDELLDKLVLEVGSELMCDLLTKTNDTFRVLPTWMYIKDKMTLNGFIYIIETLTLAVTNGLFARNVIIINGNSAGLEYRPSSENKSDKTYLFSEIWINSPDKLKQPAAGYILSQNYLFVRYHTRPAEYKEIRFLLTVLMDASLKDRNIFWHKNWRSLMIDMRAKDLHRIMKLCFTNEDEISEFKETTMSKYENIVEYCFTLLDLGYFEELNDLLTFCCPETQKRKHLKLLFIQLCFFNGSFSLKRRHLTQVELMNEFINDACDNAQLAADFKSKFVSFGVIKSVLYECVCCAYGIGYSSANLIHFIETLVQTEEVTIPLKQSVLNYAKSFLIQGNIEDVSADNLQTMLLWCLGNDDKVADFKQSIPISDLFQTYYRGEVNLSVIASRRPNVSEFLKWYFTSPEELELFEKKFAIV